MKQKLFTSLALGLALTVPSAFATELFPGTSGPATTFGAINGTVLATTSFSGVTGDLNASYTEWVVSDPSNTFCAGCLDFVIQATNNRISNDDVEDITTGNFDNFRTDAGYALTLNGSGGGTVYPEALLQGVSRTANGHTMKWNFTLNAPPDLQPGETTDYLVVETNATRFTSGAVSLQDTNILEGPGYQPTVPEPMSMGLLGGGLTLLGVARWRRSAKKD